MRIYCRYLLENYFKVFFLAIFSFIAILLVSRLKEIAEFATFGTPIGKLALFVLYQIPYILPIAIPISCLLSTLVLIQRLSQSYELTALRAAGFSLFKIASPLLMTSLFLSVGTFYLTSEVATSCHLKTRKMVYDLTSINPLLMLQNARIAQLKGAYVQMNPIHQGHRVSDLIVAIPGRSLILCLAKELEIKEDALLGSDVSVIASHEDHLAIENLHATRSPAVELAELIRTKGWKISHDHLDWRLLQARKRALLQQDSYKAHKSLIKIKSEIARRFSFALAPLTFTLMGIAFGIQRRVLTVLALTSTALIAFFIGKELDHLFSISFMLYMMPHLLITCYSLWTLQNISRGFR